VCRAACPVDWLPLLAASAGHLLAFGRPMSHVPLPTWGDQRRAAGRQLAANQGSQLTGRTAQHEEPRQPARLGHAEATDCGAGAAACSARSRALRDRCSASNCAQTCGEVLQTRRMAYLSPEARRQPAAACGRGRPTAPGSLARPRCPPRRPRRRGRWPQPQTGP